MSKRGCTVVADLQTVTYGLKRGKIGVEDKYFFEEFNKSKPPSPAGRNLVNLVNFC